MILALTAMPGDRRPGNGSALHHVDRWTKWWSRLSQIAGLALASYEIVLRPGGAQDGVLLFCAAAMLGPIGLRILLKGVGEFASRTEQELGEDEDA
jgi:hypothetical protein